MATSFDSCAICNLRHVSKLSVVWCSDCDEGLCQDCSEHHSLSKLSRNHSVVPIAEYQKLPSFLVNIKLHCDEHDEKYLLFCKEHNEVLCRKCVISKKHRECKEMFPVEDAVQNSKTSVAFTEMESSLQEMKENITLILQDRQKNISSLSASKNRLKSEILAVRLQINCHLDKIQDNFICELHRVVENSSQLIQSFIASAEKSQTEIRECIEDMETIKEHATEMQTFLGMKQLEIKLNKTESDLQSWIKNNSLADTLVSYQLHTSLGNISTETTTFGKPLVEIQSCKLLLRRKKEDQAQLVKVNVEGSFEQITLQLVAKINTSTTDVSGCCILPCGKLVVSNYKPSYLIMCTPDGNIETKITNIMSNIHDVVCIDNETVAVISRLEKNIKLVNVKSGKTFRNIPTNSSCCGMNYSEGNFIISAVNGELQEIKLENNKTNCISRNVDSVYLATFGNVIYYKKKNTNTIVCQNRQGEILWTFEDETVLIGPRGITVDEYGNVFVAGGKSKNVIAIDSSGKKYKILLSEAELRGSPWAVCYNDKLKSLLVANDCDGQALLYSVKYT